MVLVSLPAPNFIAPAILKNDEIIENFNFQNYVSGKITVLFFWPMDFTFVCPSEIIAFNNLYDSFKKRKVELIGVSIDSVFVHNAWRKTPVNEGGIGNIKFIMVSDVKQEIQKSYGIVHPTLGVALRASFLIDKKFCVRHQVVNDLPLGRNVKEMIRTIDALQFHEINGEVCPANWKKGKSAMTPSPDGVRNYFQNHLEDL
ncbi:peroxiredoxin C [Buchnera aphidicola]|uniref:peroxiredoxin C n=1 Tax=Buchnera aphidicola TaxID=9 RepID=UPI0031B67C72